VKLKLIRCDECGTVIAKVKNLCLIIDSKHHGEKHTSVLELSKLIRLATERDSETKETDS
jgi:hypothetical protein